MSWHLEEEQMERYARGNLGDTEAFSVEAHLEACHRCRSLVAAAPPERADRIWTSVLERVDAPERGRFERGIVGLGVSDHVARILAATPSMRRSWLAAATLGLAFSVIAAHQNEHGLLLFLTLAPLLPVAGVAFGYGRGVDPTYEIGLAAPMNGFRLLLVRAVAVLATTLALAGLAAFALPDLDWRAAAWLLPALCLTLASLALATAMAPERAGAWVAAAWVVAVFLAEDQSSMSLAAFHAHGQLTTAVLALVSGLVIARRQRSFDLEGTW